MTKALIDRIKIGCFGLDPIDPLRLLLDEVIEALAQLEQEPVAWLNKERNTIIWDKIYPDMYPLYTTPPQRTWVGLTHEEHMEIMTGTMTTSSRMAAVEAKLKEKNT